MGFFIGGLRKVNGQPFANPGQEGPFFEFLDALHANLIYYEFIGWAQVISGALLITQRYATLGAVIHFPISLNIAIFTVFSIGSLTPWIASLMCAGCLFLLLWDYPKWQHILAPDHRIRVDLDLMCFDKLPRRWWINGWLTIFIPFIGSTILWFNHGMGHSKVSNTIFFLDDSSQYFNLITNVTDIVRRKKV